MTLEDKVTKGTILAGIIITLTGASLLSAGIEYVYKKVDQYLTGSNEIDRSNINNPIYQK